MYDKGKVELRFGAYAFATTELERRIARSSTNPWKTP